MKSTKLFALLALLSACQSSVEQRKPASETVAADTISTKTVDKLPAQPGSADAEVIGSNDTLRVSDKVILHVTLGSEADFAGLPAFSPDSSEAFYINHDSASRVHRDENKLVFTLKSSRTVSFSNDTYKTRGDENEERDIYYRYCGNLDGLPYWMLTKQYYEWEEIILIHQVTGHQTEVWNKPIPSPDGKWLAVQNIGLDYAGGINGLQLLSLKQNKTAPEWERVLSHWEPQRIRWLDNQTIAIEERRFDPKSSEYDKPTYVRLLLSN